uniref:Uncharacterized protein n=1 Tax=Utricularia reniformis TaxID=192314 RepID=A0A1Y0B0Z1_9LAMI|nr:hypothetical protein AEK19_MT0793 [Utricularia reniformis]ART31033.1 hypothetical protein AEK19_MT0793 [Utricularia reniformis]
MPNPYCVFNHGTRKHSSSGGEVETELAEALLRRESQTLRLSNLELLSEIPQALKKLVNRTFQTSGFNFSSESNSRD